MGDASEVFDGFVEKLRNVWMQEGTDEERVRAALPIVEALVCDKTLREHSRSWPSTEGRGNYLLYESPDVPFIINAVVREPGRVGGIHDHANQWVLYGLLDGHESLDRYDRLDDGSDPGFADVRLASSTDGGPGTVDVVAPHAIHRERGSSERSVALILRHERLRSLQGRYNLETKVRTEGTHSEVPFDLKTWSLDPVVN